MGLPLGLSRFAAIIAPALTLAVPPENARPSYFPAGRRTLTRSSARSKKPESPTRLIHSRIE